jgi:L-fuconolactonase
MKVDAHQHFWDLEKVGYPWLDATFEGICRTFQPTELAPLLTKAGIDKTVLVQAANSFDENAAMFLAAEHNSWVGAIVGWVPLNLPEIAHKKLSEYEKNPFFKGIRHLIHEEKDTDWIIRDHGCCSWISECLCQGFRLEYSGRSKSLVSKGY